MNGGSAPKGSHRNRRTRSKGSSYQLVLSLLRDGQGIAEQLPAPEDYGMELEVSTTSYPRIGGWDGPSNPRIEGSLEN